MPPPGCVSALWICKGVEPIETIEVCGLKELRKSRLHLQNGDVYKVEYAKRVDEKFVAHCSKI